MKAYTTQAPMSEAARRIIADPQGRAALSNWVQNGMARPELIMVDGVTYKVTGSIEESSPRQAPQQEGSK